MLALWRLSEIEGGSNITAVVAGLNIFCYVVKHLAFIGSALSDVEDISSPDGCVYLTFTGMAVSVC